MADTDARVAFITAALVLLVMPMIFAVGLVSLLLIMRVAGMEEAPSLMLAASVVWGIIVIVGVLMVARRMIRRSARF
jgi:hypothetical protein